MVMAANIHGLTVYVGGVMTSDGQRPLPLPQLIACLEERIEVARAHETGGVSIGCVGEPIAQAVPHLRRLQELEAHRA